MGSTTLNACLPWPLSIPSIPAPNDPAGHAGLPTSYDRQVGSEGCLGLGVWEAGVGSRKRDGAKLRRKWWFSGVLTCTLLHPGYCMRKQAWD